MTAYTPNRRTNVVHRARMRLVDRRDKRSRLKGCGSFLCDGSSSPHGPCFACDGFSCSWTVRVDPATLRRRRAYYCHGCDAHDPAQARLREKRAKRDWTKVTDPIADGSLRLGVMPEQIPGPTRAALRAFQASPDDVAVVERVSAGTLNSSISTLGLSDEMYAETRGHDTVLRKVSR